MQEADLQELDYTRDDLLVAYQWIPRRHVSEQWTRTRALWNAATELEARAWRERGHRVNWGRDSLVEGVSFDFPDPQTLPSQEREIVLSLLLQQQPWPWLRSRMSLMRSWVTTRPDCVV